MYTHVHTSHLRSNTREFAYCTEPHTTCTHMYTRHHAYTWTHMSTRTAHSHTRAHMRTHDTTPTLGHTYRTQPHTTCTCTSPTFSLGQPRRTSLGQGTRWRPVCLLSLLGDSSAGQGGAVGPALQPGMECMGSPLGTSEQPGAQGCSSSELAAAWDRGQQGLMQRVLGYKPDGEMCWAGATALLG